MVADRHVRDWAVTDIDLAARRKFWIIRETARDEAGRQRGVRTGERVHHCADERAAAKAEARLVRPGRPGGGPHKQAADKARTCAVAAVGDHTAAPVVDKLAAGEIEVADRPPLGLDVHPGAGRAADHGAAGVAEFTVGEIIGSSGDDAESLSAVGAADEPADMASIGARCCADDHRPVLRVVMAENVGHCLRARVFLENEARRWNLPADVAELTANPKPFDIAVQLDVADLDPGATAGDENHRAIGRRHFGQAPAGRWPVHRSASVRVERAITEPGSAAQLSAIAEDAEWLRKLLELEDRRGRPPVVAAAVLGADYVRAATAEHDRAAAATVHFGRQSGKGARVISRSIAFRAEVLRLEYWSGLGAKARGKRRRSGTRPKKVAPVDPHRFSVTTIAPI